MRASTRSTTLEQERKYGCHMELRQLGTSEVRVSKLALGCFSFAGDNWKDSDVHKGVWGQQLEQDSFAAVRAALDAGINTFDNAEQYGDGHAESVLGRAVAAAAPPRDSIVVATKANAENLEPTRLAQALDASLRRLQMNYVDLYQVHWPSRSAVRTAAYPDRPLAHEVPLRDTLGELARLKSQGKIRAVGVCNFGPLDLQEAVSLYPGLIVSNQVSYSLISRAIEDELVPLCMRHRVSILAWSPLQQGLLAGKFRTADDVPAARQRTRHFSRMRPLQRHGEAGHEHELFAAIERLGQISDRLRLPMADVAIGYAMHRPGVTSVLVGARNAAQVLANVNAASTSTSTTLLSASVMAELDAATDQLKRLMGPNLDPYESTENSRIR
eukprot:TRINITY_DN2231_c0_g1_i1.p1 TRINITY_DN2231_c0_g1~~TRINITY_DN2231_c0_g1_i1.p1  ORF type:complete len:385 (+),score=143.32 TRINITY_DN2231_c0_g1_i1:214-1368(+)